MFKIQKIAKLVLFISIFCHTLGGVVYLFDSSVLPSSLSAVLPLYGCLLLSVVGSSVIPFIKKEKLFYFLVIGKIVLILLIAGPDIGHFVLILILTAPFTLEVAIYFPYPRNMMLSFTALSAVFIKVLIPVFREKMHGSVDYSLMIACFAVLSISCIVNSLVLYYRERIVRETKERKKIELTVMNLMEANKGFQQYATSIEQQSLQKERNRITRELHDGLGYIFTNLKMMMDAAEVLIRKDQPDELHKLLTNAREQADQGLDETRKCLYFLRKTENSIDGIRNIQNMIGVFRKASGIEVCAHYGNIPWSFGSRIDGTVFRLVQEGMINSFRHGKATKIDLGFWQTDSEIHVHIRDNGTGAAEMEEGIGLLGMKERLEQLGGSMAAHNVIGGFELSVVIPYKVSITYE